MITDDALRAAAKEASLALAEALTQGSKQQPPYVPSKSFTCKMSRLCRRERHPVFYRTLQRVAAVFLALLLTGIGWLTIDAEARAAADVAGLYSDMAARRLRGTGAPQG